MKVYFNPRCSKCRIAKEFLENNNIDFEIIEYLELNLVK